VTTQKARTGFDTRRHVQPRWTSTDDDYRPRSRHAGDDLGSRSRTDRDSRSRAHGDLDKHEGPASSWQQRRRTEAASGLQQHGRLNVAAVTVTTTTTTTTTTNTSTTGQHGRVNAGYDDDDGYIGDGLR